MKRISRRDLVNAAALLPISAIRGTAAISAVKVGPIGSEIVKLLIRRLVTTNSHHRRRRRATRSCSTGKTWMAGMAIRSVGPSRTAPLWARVMGIHSR